MRYTGLRSVPAMLPLKDSRWTGTESSALQPGRHTGFVGAKKARFSDWLRAGAGTRDGYFVQSKAPFFSA